MLEFKAHFKSVQPDLGGSLPGQLIFGIPGKDGGYYTIQITQPDSDTMRLTFTASKEGMEKIAPADILLPKGPKGEPGEVDMDQILRFVDEYLSQNPPQVAEKDPTVPDWAKEETKPSYSKSEVGLGNVDNVRQYSASNPPPYPVASVNGQTGKVQLGATDVGARPSNWMPTAQEVGALPDTYVPPDQTAAQVGADPAGTAAAVVSAHNTSTDSHGDLRLELKAINDRLTAFFDSDNQTLDELSEIVAYITSNKALIDSITTSKVSVADIINNLTTNVANKPLSAAQGVALKGLIDAVGNSLSNYQPMGDYALRSELPTVPTKVSQLENDKGYLTEHQDISGKLDADKLPEAVNAALAQAKDSGEFDGDPGAPGVTPHIGSNGNWYIGSADTGVKAQGKDGTSVTVKSVSESTADGGSNVVTFSDGKALTVKNGKQGSAGKTPIRGVDYYTEADKAEFSEYIASELAKRGQLKPEFAESLEWLNANGDHSKLYVLPDGFIYAYMLTEVETGPAYTNVLPTAINADKTPYVGTNGEKGYKTGYRLNSSRVEKEASDRCCTGFIPVKYTDEIRFKNIIAPEGPTYNGYLFFYNSDFSNNGMAYEFEGIWDNVIIPSQIKNLVSTATNATNTTAYMRLSTAVIDESSIITINEEIMEGGGTSVEYAWANTGHAFVPADYESQILGIAQDVAALEKKVDAIGSGTTTVPGETISSDEVEILIPSTAVAVVGVEFNVYHKSIIRAKRDISNYDIKIYLSNSSIVCSRYAECFRLTPAAGDVGDYTCTVEVRNLKDYAVIASKSMTLHIIANTAVSGKNVLFIGDSLTFSRAGLYPAEIQYNLSNGGMTSIGTQNGSADINQVGNVKHEGYNGATIGGFLKEKVTSAFTNPFYNPATSTFDLGYFLSNNGYSKVDAVCLNLGHNNFGNEVAGVNDLKTIIQKIHDYDASIPVIISLVPPLGDQDSSYRLGFSAGQMRFYWRQLIKAYIDAFDNGQINNVYLSTPYFNVDQDNDMPTETVSRCARDSAQIVRQNDSHPTRVGTLKMADSYYANLVYYLR